MDVTVKKLDRGQAEIKVTLTVDEYQPFLTTAAKNISQGVDIPGFRRGKATLEAVTNQVGNNQVWQEAIEPAVQKTLGKAIDQEQLTTVGSPHIDILKLAVDNDVEYKATVNLLPSVELPDLTTVSVAAKPVAVASEKIEKALTDLQKMRASEAAVSRAAKVGDKVVIDFDSFLDRVAVENGGGKKFPLVIGEHTFIPGFEDELIGLTPGQSKKFTLTFPKNYHAKNLAGKPVDFQVTLHEVFEITLPELTDQFAQGLGEFKTVHELRDKMKENLTAEEQAKQQQATEEELLEKIIEKSKIGDVPDMLVDSETKKMLEELEHSLSHQGVQLTDYLIHLKKSREELLLDFVPQAIKRIKSALILREVTKQQQIEVTNDDIETEVKKMLAAHRGHDEAQHQATDPAFRAYVRNVLASRKVIDYLKSIIVKNKS